MCEPVNGVTSAIVLLFAVAGIIALTIVRKRRANNEYTINDFIDENYNKLVNVLVSVVNLLMVNVNDYPDKESYERDIIRLTIEKLYTNCDEFGIESALIKMINKDALANTLYDLLHREEAQVFANNIPAEVIEDNAELYNENVLDAVIIESADMEFDNNDDNANENIDSESAIKDISEAVDNILNEEVTE